MTMHAMRLLTCALAAVICFRGPLAATNLRAADSQQTPDIQHTDAAPADSAPAPEPPTAKTGPHGLRMLFDSPLRDPSICVGPDGMYYLTGTSPPFWSYNNESGIRVWRSKDLVTWEPLGTVWRYGESPWHAKYREAKKPLWAPEIHCFQGTFWLTHSMPGWDGSA